jgi:hypothetical protein
MAYLKGLLNSKLNFKTIWTLLTPASPPSYCDSAACKCQVNPTATMMKTVLATVMMMGAVSVSQLLSLATHETHSNRATI